MTTYRDLTRNPVVGNITPFILQTRLLWCNAHRRRYQRCYNGEGGILLPCDIVDLTGLVEIEDEYKHDEENRK